MYTTFIYNPLYNGLILLIDIVKPIPWIDAGIVVIIFTLIVRLILFPLSKKAARTQIMMRQAEPELAALREKYKDDRQALALQTMAFYKDKKISPFSSILLLIIQLPILFALYRIFYNSGLSVIHPELLYSFVRVPAAINSTFIGLFDVTQRSIFLAVLAGVSQYLQLHLSLPKVKRDAEGKISQESMMHVMMRFMMPVMIAFVASTLASALALYWITSNLFMAGQELYVRRQLARESEPKRI